MRGRRSQRAAALTLAVSLALLSYAAADETTSADTTTRPPFGKKRLSEDEEKEVPRNLQVDIVTANAQNEDKLLWFLGPERTLKFRPDTCGVGGDELLQYTICMDGFTPNRLRAETFGVNPSIQLVLQQLTATATGTACVWPKLKPLASAAIPLDPSKRGKMKYSDACSTELDCGFPDSICDEILKTCRCHSDTPVSNHVDKCGKPAGINESCIFNEQCEDVVLKTECRNERCVCMYEMVAEVSMDGAIMCVPAKQIEESTRTLDPAMIGVLVGMALMFIIICVVLQLFSRARWRENRTIFNTPNPRLMNVSLLRDSKLLHSQDRRESHVSMRPPSRHASQQELRPHSPGAGSRRGSRASSGHSASSLRSATLRSPTTPGPTSVTVEIRAPDN